MMRMIFAASLAILFALVPTSAWSERRVALVVGINAYPVGGLGPLRNAVPDAVAIAEMLRGLRFEVTLVTDADKVTFRRALDAFETRNAGADLSLFYFAGHGMLSEGETYLLARDSAPSDPRDLRAETRMDDIRRAVEPAQRRVVILDACRDNPLAARTRGVRSGLGHPPRDVAETLFLYSAAPGQQAQDGLEGGNSPFAEAVLRTFPRAGREIVENIRDVRLHVLQATGGRQRPVNEETFVRPLFLAGPAAQTPPPNTAVAPAPTATAAPSANLAQPPSFQSVVLAQLPTRTQATLRHGRPTSAVRGTGGAGIVIEPDQGFIVFTVEFPTALRLGSVELGILPEDLSRLAMIEVYGTNERNVPEGRWAPIAGCDGPPRDTLWRCSFAARTLQLVRIEMRAESAVTVLGFAMRPP